MKITKLNCILLFFLALQYFVAQNGIGTTTPNVSAKLEVAATDRGFLAPRIGLTSANAAAPINSPANGLLVFNTASSGSGSNRVTPGYYYWDARSSLWLRLTSSVNIGDVKTGLQTADHNGWVRLDGRAKSTLTAAQQAQATALGIGNNLPDATNAVLMQSSGTLGELSGSMSRVLAQNQLPDVAPIISIASAVESMQSTGSHVHSIGVTTRAGSPLANPNAFKTGMSPLNEADVATTDRGASSFANTGIIDTAGEHSHTMNAHTHSATSSSINGGVTQQVLDITPRSLSVNTFIYLGF